MDTFVLNDILWTIKIVNPNSRILIDREGTLTVATTDPTNHTVYLSQNLNGKFLVRVLLHELGHCAMISFGLLEEIHRLVPRKYWIDVEEWACNFIADYGWRIFTVASQIYGFDAWRYIPNELNKWIA